MAADDRRGVSNGPNSHSLNDTVGETGPGIPDDAVMDGELEPGALEKGADQAVEALEKSGWTHRGSDEGSPEGESGSPRK